MCRVGHVIGTRLCHVLSRPVHRCVHSLTYVLNGGVVACIFASWYVSMDPMHGSDHGSSLGSVGASGKRAIFAVAQGTL